MSDIKIYGKLVNATTDNVLVGSDQTYDETQGKFQSEINKEVADKLGNGTTEINKELAEVKSDLGSHKSNIDNPHGVTKTQVGLGNVTNDSQVKRSEMGTANGVATLDNQGLVPTSQLPSYVDDVIDVYATYTKDNAGILTNIKIFSDLDKTQAVTGESGKIYIDVESNYQFRWTGTQYVTVGAPTVLGEVTGTAYDGGKGKAVADEVEAIKKALNEKADIKDLNEKADNLVFTDSINGLVPRADTTAEKSTAVLTAEGKWMLSYDAAKSRTKGTFLAAPINADGKADFRSINLEDLPDSIQDIIVDQKSYGVSWKTNITDPVVTRVGNMTYHKTLPIQNNMKGCIAQMKNDAEIIYFLDPTDWRWREEPIYLFFPSASEKINITDNTCTIIDDTFSTLQYENQWLKIKEIPCQVISIDTSTKTATVKPDSPIKVDDSGAIIELGAVLNGYDGEVMVLVPEFWIKSWDITTDIDIHREVRISPSKIDDTWEHQPKILISPYHDTVLNTIPENMGYLSTLEVNSAISVVNINDYCRGGDNSSNYDSYITSDRFRSMLGKPRTNISRATMRDSCRKSGKEIISYLQYKRVLYWLYVIEYANFNCRDEFNSELTSEGFKQGGLGNGVTNASWLISNYNKRTPLTPNGYTNEFGNGTNTKDMRVIFSSGDNTTEDITLSVPRWHGIENPFGDIHNNVDGIIIIPSSIVENNNEYNEVYITDNLLAYNDSDYSRMRVAGIEINKDGWVNEWDLGNTAEIIPRTVEAQNNKCGYNYTSSSAELKTLILGGMSTNKVYAGLGYFDSSYATTSASNSIGFRSSCIIP